MQTYLTCSTDKFSKFAFSKNCFRSILQLVQLYNEQPELEDETQQILAALKDLLRTHVLQPARSAVLNSLRPRDVQSTVIPRGFLESLLAPLTDLLSGDGIASQSSLKSAALLFEIAAEDSKHTTAKGKREETIWLKKLFEHIMQGAHALEYRDLDHVQQTRLVEFSVMMLEKAVRLKTQLKAATLEKLLQPLFRHPRIFTEGEWNLVGLCIQLEPAVFIGSPRGIHVNKERSLNFRNELLVSLLDQIDRDGYKLMSTSTGPQSRPNVTLPYETILSTVVNPLAQAFVQARELPRFLDIWQEQLEKSLHTETNDVLNIWKDEEFLQTVASLLESTLAVSEIEKRLHLIEAGLQPLPMSAGPNQFEKKNALLFVAEALLLGCKSDRTLQKLEDHVLAIYKLLLQLMTDGTERRDEVQIKCWMIMTVINDKWSLSHQSLEHEDDAICLAMRTIESACSTERQPHNFRRGFHAFRFMLSLVEVQKAKMNAGQAEAPNGIAADPIGTVINHILAADFDVEGVDRGEVQAPEWDGDDFIDSGTLFCLACCAQLATVPRTLR